MTGGYGAYIDQGTRQLNTSASNDPAAQIDGVIFNVSEGGVPTFEPAGMTVTQNGSQVILSDIPAGTRTINITNNTAARIVFSAIDVQYSLPAIVEGQYLVLPGTEVSVKATAAPLHHVTTWKNESGVAYENASFSDYVVTTPDNLLPTSTSIKAKEAMCSRM